MTKRHATCIAIDDQGILLTGPSGSGKSDLALRLIEQGARLVSDDYTEIVRKGSQLIGFAPPNIAGLLEVRHIGVVRFQHLENTTIRLSVHLAASDSDLERMPELTYEDIDGISIPKVELYAFHASTPAKVGLALALSLGHLERME